MKRTLTIDNYAKVVRLDGKEIELTPLEFKLVKTFASKPEWILSRDTVLDSINYLSNQDRTIDVYVGYLRRKLGTDFIVTKRGYGYKINSEAYSIEFKRMDFNNAATKIDSLKYALQSASIAVNELKREIEEAKSLASL